MGEPVVPGNTVEAYLTFWKRHYSHVRVEDDECTDKIRANATQTILLSNGLLTCFGHHRDITSGWRPRTVNVLVPGAAIKSNHILGCAVDLEDMDGELDAYCMANKHVLEDFELYLEHPESTIGWCHLQTVPPGSGNRVFRIK